MTGRRGTARRPETAPLAVNVAGLLVEPPGTARSHDLAGVTIPLDDDLRLASPIEGGLRLTRTNRGLLVEADLATALEETCSRCLRPIEVPVDVRIREEALPSRDIATGLPVDTDAEPDVLRLTSHHELDLEPVVRAEISLAEPIAPVCRPDCPGLCVTCGEPLEVGDHDHQDDDIDPRLAALRGFRAEDDDDGDGGEAGDPDEADPG